jgi:DUF1680 family protein
MQPGQRHASIVWTVVQPSSLLSPASFWRWNGTWSPGDIVQLDLPMPIQCQANEDVIALMRGPLTYAYFQDAQPDAQVFHHRRGLYPEDVSLRIDPGQVLHDVEEEVAPAGLLGPVLRMQGQIRGRGPLFSSQEANAALPAKQEQTVWLHPFVNQGAIRGESGCSSNRP